MNKEQTKSTNTDRDEGSSVVVEERQRLKEMRAQSAKKESCVLFYCKECKGLVTVTKHPKKYSFTCNMCKSKHVAFGTEVSIKKFFRLKDDESFITEEDYKKRLAEEAERDKERKARRAARNKKKEAVKK